MSTKEWVQDIDEEKDYYRTLGVSSKATSEELKAAYVQLALQHHPDTSPAGEEQKHSSEFIKVAEAWSILSKPETRSRYDTLRNTFLGIASNSYGHASDGSFVSSQPTGFTIQRDHYTNNIKRKAGACFDDQQELSRHERWHNLPLKDKKMYRHQKVVSLGFGMSKLIVPAVGFTGLVVSAMYVLG